MAKLNQFQASVAQMGKKEKEQYINDQSAMRHQELIKKLIQHKYGHKN